MESRPARWNAGTWNEFGPWSTATVLRRDEIPLSNLGVLVELDAPNSPIRNFAPAFVYQTGLPRQVGATPCICDRINA